MILSSGTITEVTYETNKTDKKVKKNNFKHNYTNNDYNNFSSNAFCWLNGGHACRIILS